MLDVNRVHVIVLVHILAEQLNPRGTTGSHVFRSGMCSSSVGGVTVMAVGREQLGEDAANDGPEEGKTGADDGNVAFCSCPVGGSNVAVFAVVSTMI